VLVASGFIIKMRFNLPDDLEWPGPTPAELSEFLSGLRIAADDERHFFPA
jgi:hypothetical protein